MLVDIYYQIDTALDDEDNLASLFNRSVSREYPLKSISATTVSEGPDGMHGESGTTNATLNQAFSLNSKTLVTHDGGDFNNLVFNYHRLNIKRQYLVNVKRDDLALFTGSSLEDAIINHLRKVIKLPKGIEEKIKIEKDSPLTKVTLSFKEEEKSYLYYGSLEIAVGDYKEVEAGRLTPKIEVKKEKDQENKPPEENYPEGSYDPKYRSPDPEPTPKDDEEDLGGIDEGDKHRDIYPVGTFKDNFKRTTLSAGISPTYRGEGLYTLPSSGTGREVVVDRTGANDVSLSTGTFYAAKKISAKEISNSVTDATTNISTMFPWTSGTAKYIGDPWSGGRESYYYFPAVTTSGSWIGRKSEVRRWRKKARDFSNQLSHSRTSPKVILNASQIVTWNREFCEIASIWQRDGFLNIDAFADLKVILTDDIRLLSALTFEIKDDRSTHSGKNKFLYTSYIQNTGDNSGRVVLHVFLSPFDDS